MSALQSDRGPRPTVSIVYRAIPHYRRPFYEGLRDELAQRGITLRLLYGKPMAEDELKHDTVDLPWAEPIESREFQVGRTTLIWQPVLSATRGDDLIIVEQASKLLVNYPLVALNVLGVRRIAFWGHGRNFQAHQASAVGEAIKRWMSRRVAWWFAYNDASASVIQDLGYPAARITSVQNTILTDELIVVRDTMSDVEIRNTRLAVSVPPDSRPCVLVGGLYPDKRLPFLLDACDRIRSALPGFEMLFIGSGVSLPIVEAAAESRPWVHALGARFGAEQARLVRSCELLLMPGLVGLAVIDSFALGVPMVTTQLDYHSPEFSYLIDGVNGVVVAQAESAAAYADVVVGLLGNRAELDRLRAGCIAAAEHYTMRNMVMRFADGVQAALASDHSRKRQR